MRYAPLWQQANGYPAQLDRYLLGALWPGGGVQGGAATAVAGTMNVSIAAGSAAVPLAPGQGSALCHWDAAELVTIDPAPPSGQSRVDLIVAQVRDNQVDGGPSNDFVFAVVKGTAALSATARPGEAGDGPEAEQQATPPAVPQNALAVALVTVPGGAANLNGAGITGPLGPMIGPTVKMINPATQVSLGIGGSYDPHGELAFDFVARSDRMLLSGESYMGLPSGVNTFKVGFASPDMPNGPNNPAVTLEQGQVFNGRMHWETVASGLTVGKLYANVMVCAAAYGSVLGRFVYGGSPLGSMAGDIGPLTLKAEPI